METGAIVNMVVGLGVVWGAMGWSIWHYMAANRARERDASP